MQLRDIRKLTASAMTEQKNHRVMWLLNHVAARKFEIPMLKSIGINEIFLPKIIPPDHNFRSASVDFSEDGNLTIPSNDLAILNSADWYRDPGVDAWRIANKYFDVAFFIVHRFEMLASIAKHFSGAAIWRAYGLDASLSYSHILASTRDGSGWKDIHRMGNRFWFGEAYQHLDKIERPALRERAIYLPLGLSDSQINAVWTGQRQVLFFVCPEIGFNPYYRKIYDEFRKSFSGFDYVVGGSQPIKVEDEKVLGFVSAEEHLGNMRDLRVIFYHSTEPNHIHYHPFEAVRVGMPLVFMAGGLLDRLGGVGLPGRCKSIAEARDKIRRILGDDHKLIDEIRATQPRLLEPMRPDVCRPAWAENFGHILAQLEVSLRAKRIDVAPKRKRIAVILPVQYRGGTLRAAKLLAVALWQGSRRKGEDADVIFGHVDDPAFYSMKDFEDLPSAIVRRPYKWTFLDGPRAHRAMTYAGFETWQPASEEYMVPDDGARQFLDCDLWLVISDRLSQPLLPIRPYVLLVHDYLQRYLPYGSGLAEYSFLAAARLAERVLVTTQFTEGDALQYGGIDPQRVIRVPMLVPKFEPLADSSTVEERPYFIWPTNAAVHKNHVNAFKALRIYWEEMGGNLVCHVTGVSTSELLDGEKPFLKLLGNSEEDVRGLRARIRLKGELPDSLYQREMAGARFLWHPAQIDNGTFSVVDAAHVGVPALSSDYPAMHEIDKQFELDLAWTTSSDPDRMARALKWMEDHCDQRRSLLPSSDKLEQRHVDAFASQYWNAVRECL
jgi:glycosyltransferase involved in cell wall biosynthesis